MLFTRYGARGGYRPKPLRRGFLPGGYRLLHSNGGLSSVNWQRCPLGEIGAQRSASRRLSGVDSSITRVFIKTGPDISPRFYEKWGEWIVLRKHGVLNRKRGLLKRKRGGFERKNGILNRKILLTALRAPSKPDKLAPIMADFRVLQQVLPRDYTQTRDKWMGRFFRSNVGFSSSKGGIVQRKHGVLNRKHGLLYRKHGVLKRKRGVLKRKRGNSLL